MKKITRLIFIIGIITSVNSHAQNDVYLKINHFLGSAAFDPTITTNNDLGNQFTVSRLNYYISQIKLIYDGGMDTVLADKYIIVDANQTVNEHLGNFPINSLEAIEFGIGVDAARNHSDISTYPPNHPLSFQTPSMHWGWTAGYRFVAMEGLTGDGMSSIWQLHALGDMNYGFASINTTGTQSGNDLIIDIDADYSKALNGITIDGNLIYHGEGQQAPDLLQNFQSVVFSEAVPGIGLKEMTKIGMELFPNPSTGNFNIRIEAEIKADLRLVVTDVFGREILNREFIEGHNQHTENLLPAGTYLVQLYGDETLVGIKRLIVVP